MKRAFGLCAAKRNSGWHYLKIRIVKYSWGKRGSDLRLGLVGLPGGDVGIVLLDLIAKLLLVRLGLHDVRAELLDRSRALGTGG